MLQDRFEQSFIFVEFRKKILLQRLEKSEGKVKNIRPKEAFVGVGDDGKNNKTLKYLRISAEVLNPLLYIVFIIFFGSYSYTLNYQ